MGPPSCMRSVVDRNVVMRRIFVICIHIFTTFRSAELNPTQTTDVGQKLFLTATTKVEEEDSNELVYASTTPIPEMLIHCCSLFVMVSVRHAIGGTLSNGSSDT